MSDLFASNFQANFDQYAQLLHLCCNAMLQTQRCALPETFTDRRVHDWIVPCLKGKCRKEQPLLDHKHCPQHVHLGQACLEYVRRVTTEVL